MAAIQREVVSEDIREKGERTGEEGAVGVGAGEGPEGLVSDRALEWKPWKLVVAGQREMYWVVLGKGFTDPWELCRNQESSQSNLPAGCCCPEL